MGYSLVSVFLELRRKPDGDRELQLPKYSNNNNEDEENYTNINSVINFFQLTINKEKNTEIKKNILQNL